MGDLASGITGFGNINRKEHDTSKIALGHLVEIRKNVELSFCHIWDCLFNKFGILAEASYDRQMETVLTIYCFCRVMQYFDSFAR